NIVRIDKQEGPMPSCYEQMTRMVCWDLRSMKTLVYASPNRNDFRDFFQRHKAFKISVASETFRGNTVFLQVSVGRYRGRTEKFDPLNYMHQRHALLGGIGQLEEDSLKAGVKGHRVYWGNVINKGLQAAKWVADPAGTFAEKVITGKPKYFMAFSDQEHSRVVHMQEAIHHLLIGRVQEITLGDFWTQFGKQLEDFLDEL